MSKTVFINGCFDPLHGGHILMLKAAAQLGDRVVVAINDDASLRRLKGPDRPRVPLHQRMTALRELRCVDEVIPFSEDNAVDVLRSVRPAIVVKGNQYNEASTVERQVIEKLGAELKFVPMLPGISSTVLTQERQPCLGGRVHVIADLAIDHYCISECIGVSEEFPHAVGQLMREEWYPGGGASLAVSLRRLNALGRLYGVVGSDLVDNRLKDLLQAEQVCCDDLCTYSGAWTSTFGKIMQGRSGSVRREVTRLDTRPMRASIESARESLTKSIESMQPVAGDVVVVSRYECASRTAVTETAVSLLKERVDGGVLLVGACRTTPSAFRGFYAVVVNEMECLACLSQQPWLKQATPVDVQAFAKYCETEHVVVTRGEKGAFLWSRQTGNVCEFSTIPCAPGTDPTGAGDVFLAAFVAALAACQSVATAVQEAVCAATNALFSQRRPAVAVGVSWQRGA